MPEIKRLLTLVQTGKTPNIYGAVYHRTSADFKDPMDGAKRVAVELIAEHANRRTKKDGMRLKLVGTPIISGDVAGILIQRSGGGIEEGIFSAYLYRDKKNGWGFLGFPIPYERRIPPGFPRDSDDKFYEDALNDLTPYDGVLYDFDKAVKKQYEAVTNKLEDARRAQAKQSGERQPTTPPDLKPKLKKKPKSKPESKERSQ